MTVLMTARRAALASVSTAALLVVSSLAVSHAAHAQAAPQAAPQAAQAGDVVWYPGHVMLYLGVSRAGWRT